MNISYSGDTILIDHAQGKPYKECEHFKRSECSIKINRSLSFIGINGTAIIQCRRFCNLFRVQDYSSNRIRVVFANLVLSRSDALVRCSKTSFELAFEQCIFKNYYTGLYTKSSKHCSIKTFNSRFEESGEWGIWASCINLTVNFTATIFNASPVALQTTLESQRRWQTTEVFISNCVFDGRQKHFCAELVSVKPFAVVVNITVSSSRFINHYGVCPRKWFSTFLILDANYNERKATMISLNELLFVNNTIQQSAMRLIPALKDHKAFDVELVNSVFTNNTGALVIYVKDVKRSHIREGPKMWLFNNTFIKNVRGFGNKTSPAIDLREGRIHVTFCRFLDNMPGSNLFAAAITISHYATVILENCYYENNQTNSKSLQVYAKTGSRLSFVGNNTFNINALKTNQGTFLFMPSGGSPGMFLKGSFRILCPHGYVLRTESQCTVTKKHIACFYFYSSCEQCPPKTYSLKRGELHNKITYEMKCQDCPRGGQCEAGHVVAKPNFWGYRKKKKVSFLACPPKYCCDTENCNSYDSCHGNRTGALCGQCPEGMSESLFNTKCKSNKECRSFIFWPGVSCLLILYLVFFLYNEEIAKFIWNGLSLTLPLISRIQETNVDNSIEYTSLRNNQNSISRNSGFLKITFYYFQVDNLFRNCVGTRRNQYILGKLDKIFSRFFNLIVINIPSFDCPFQNLRPVQKMFILHSVGYCLLALVGLVCFFIKIFRVIKRLRRVENNNQQIAVESLETVDRTLNQRPTPCFSVRIVSAYIHISLLMYSSSAQLCLSLLHCVPMGVSHVLFIDGTVKCYQTFQYFLLAYVVFSIFPFCIVPVLGSYLLKGGRISVCQFCVACVMPLPFCCFWIYLLLKNFCQHGRRYKLTEQERDASTHDHNNEVTPSARAILSVLSGPFRSHKTFLCFPCSALPWEGFLIFRRLVLIIVLTFIYDPRLQMILALIICITILISHMYVNPFISSRDNLLETMSLGTLIVLCGLTLVKSLYEGEDFSSSSSSLSLLNTFDIMESILTITPMAVISFIVILSLLIRLLSCFRFCIRSFLQYSSRLGRA